ncbi:Autophagy-related protein 3 [Tetrabaena socialis]|uniref:Autophagy-related protein 3 n=1 Tax=Tetrabaena socialis TaxID=47790 RepID=A0A2J8ABN8_9CHLO|nr:Autophagy-related protein 3 [Tetrabaena socialis]|eukprot:PNH09907.1 Autophagy-related protein 3 [Tetrabaena socialis]
MNVKHALHSLFKQTVEKIAPPLTKSQFAEKRVLTPEEFVAAGDGLVHACPTWSWYLVLFLKFMASVLPTIQYDYTMSVGGE